MQPNNGSNHLNRHLAPNFQVEEFICPCCAEEGIKNDLVLKLQMAHDFLPPNSVMIINSGYRCKKHNKKVGGAHDSAHRKGLAADIQCLNSSERYFLIVALINAGFRRIGMAENFIHCDLDGTKVQSVIWDYY